MKLFSIGGKAAQIVGVAIVFVSPAFVCLIDCDYYCDSISRFTPHKLCNFVADSTGEGCL